VSLVRCSHDQPIALIANARTIAGAHFHPFPMRQHALWRAVVVAGAVLAGTIHVPAHAQPPRAPGAIAGTVTDSATGLPVVGAEVRLVEQHRVDRTHEDGGFEFRDLSPGNYMLSVRRLGYRESRHAVAVTSGGTAQARVVMRAAAVELSPTLVTGSLSERPGEEVLSPTSVLSGAALDRKLDATLAQSLLSTPGVSVTSISPSTSRPIIRGLGGDRIVVLEDGQRPGDLSAMSGDHAVTIDPLNASRIEVVRGPMSLLYGSSALGGVVNVVREEIPTSRPDRLHASLNLQGATVNSSGSVGGFALHHLGDLAVRAEGSIRSAGNTQTPEGELVNTGVAESNVAIGAALTGTGGHVGTSFRRYENEYGIPGGFVGGHASGVDISMRRNTFRTEGDLHLEGGPFSSLTATGVYTDYHHTEFEPSGSIGTLFGQEFITGELTARHNAVGPVALGALGLRAQYRDITTGGSLQTPSTWDVSLAAFLVEEVATGPFRWQAGVRYDWAKYTPREATFIDVGGVRVPVRERTFGSLSGSAGFLYEVSSGVRLGASVNRAYRTPDFNELYSNGPHLAANSFNVGDPNLKEETGIGLDAFVRVTRGRMNAEVAGFTNRLANFIFESSRGRAEIGTQGGRPRFQYTNEAARFTGAEGRLEWSLSQQLVFEATASYVAARFTSERDSIPVISAEDTMFVAASKYPPFIPPLNGQVGLRLDRTRWFVSLGGRYASRQDRLGDFEAPTSGYLVPNGSAGIRLVRGSQLHTLTLRIDNAFDRTFRDHLSRIKAIMPEPGRNVSLLYRLTL
jgi:iron complex outermembrane recepter protein